MMRLTYVTDAFGSDLISVVDTLLYDGVNYQLVGCSMMKTHTPTWNACIMVAHMTQI